MTSLADMQATPETLDLFLTAIEYTTVETMPVTHLFGRDASGQRHHIEVTGHRPSFYVRAEEFTDRVANHYAVRGHERGYETLDGDDAVRVYTNLPEQVPDTRELFDEHFEADVLYERRFLIDTGITTGVRVELHHEKQTLCGGDKRVPVSAVSPCEAPDVEPRVCTVDIEVASEDGFPDAQEASDPVVSIVAHDSYSDEYTGWLLRPDDSDVDASGVCSQTHVFGEEDRLLDDFNTYVDAYEPDLLSGWNSSSTNVGDAFDLPYVINRCRELGVWSYFDWSPLEDVFVTRFGTTVVGGVETFDMLDAYVKSQVHTLDSKALDDVAAKECDASKVEFAGSHTDLWRRDPKQLLEYNRRDVELVVDIEQSGGLIAMFNQLREVTGGTYDDCFAAIDMLDPMFLAEANERDMCLPTATEPERSWFYGGHVHQPNGGLHENVIYWDVASMYPNILTMLNISPENIVGVNGNEDEHVHSYIDTRSEDVKQSDDPSRTKFYYEDSEGFVSSIVDEILVLTEQTSGKRREALKRTRNACWGVLGDGDSYGTGFRLFNWKMGESVTLAGQRILKWTMDTIVDELHDRGYDDASVVVADTDGCGVSIPSLDGTDEAQRLGGGIAQTINQRYEDFTQQEFNADSEMEIEMESYATKLYTSSSKKRYSQRVLLDDGEKCDEIVTKGFECVRSDVADVTTEAQEQLFELLLTQPLGQAMDEYGQYLRDLLQQIDSGEYPLAKLGQTGGLGQSLDKYGSTDRTPQPIYRGSKFANEHIYGENAIGEGDRPQWWYISSTGELPTTYTADTAEDGQKVDAIAVLDAADLPDSVEIDTSKMEEKVIEDAVAPILSDVGYRYDDLVSSHSQTDVLQFM